MISDATIDRYYYIYDGRNHRALVMDRTTGEEFAWTAAPRAQLIDHVAGEADEALLRTFARWCAAETGAGEVPVHTATGRLWRALRHGDRDAWRRTREGATDAITMAATVGLSRREPSAARLLAVHACTYAEPRRAARHAAHMSERWAELQDADPAQSAHTHRQRQLDWLLDALDRTAPPPPRA
jgi:hypothetical protein